MEISNISSLLGMQQELATNAAQTTGEEFKNALTQAARNQDDEELKASCNQIEAYMLSMVFKQMKESMLSNDEDTSVIPEGDYTKTFESTMIDTMAEKMTEAGGIGLSQQIYQQVKNTYATQMQVSSQNQEIVATTQTLANKEE